MSRLAYIIAAVGLLAVLGAAALVWVGRASLPIRDGALFLQGLRAPVTVGFDGFGVPVITAESRPDALQALGFVTAQDRLFQMDLLRRSTAGRLAELFGEPAVEADQRQRRWGFARVADAVWQRLPEEQQAALVAYAEGVNAFLARMSVPPPECVALGYRPEPWQPTDSLLIVLGLFQILNGYEDDERMRTVMADVLPPDVAAFLLPAADPYTARLLRGETEDTPTVSVPVESLAQLRRTLGQSRAMQSSLVPFRKVPLGSNAWAAAGAKSHDGRALLANDMHLDVAVPNIWYRVQLRYEDVHLVGAVVPGIPVVIIGSNGRVAWALTNIEGDFLDLVRLTLNHQNPNEYATADGWRTFTTRRETVRVKGGHDRRVAIKETIWGPVAETALLGHPVAVRWTALDPDAVDLGLLQMERAGSVTEAIAVMNRAGGPPNNVLLADAEGHIAWTYTGRIPIRRGFDGSVSVSWANGRIGWAGYVPPEELPRIVDPPSGFLVSANHRMTDETYPYVIGHTFANGYRAYRITERLQAMRQLREAELFALQLDTTTALHEFYRHVAQQVLSDEVVRQRPELADLRRALEGWDGRAEADSRGLALLVEFRRALAEAVFAPYVAACRERDAAFAYDGDLDTPLRALLIEQAPEVLPEQTRFPDWPSFIRHVLEHSAWKLKEEYRASSIEDLTWGRLSRVRIVHPLADVFPGLGWLLNMPEAAAPGCGQCVRVVSGTLTASQRMVVSPAHESDGMFHMPGGQSGHPLSPHFRDQQPYWSEGTASPLLAGPIVHRLRLEPPSEVQPL